MPLRRIPQTDASDQDIIDATRAILRYELPPGASQRGRADLENLQWGLKIEPMRFRRTYAKRKKKAAERRFW